MHKIQSKEFVMEDFSCEHLSDRSISVLERTISELNLWRDIYNNGYPAEMEHPEIAPHSKQAWWQMIQLLPSSYNQKRTVMFNYEVLANIYKSRMNHKLDEWSGKDCFKDLARDCNTCVKNGTDDCHGGRDGGFIQWIEALPYHELITGEFGDNTAK